MKNEIRSEKEERQMKDKAILKTVYILSTAICFMFFLFAPLELYFTNKNEFWYDIGVLFPIMACVFLAFTSICVLGFLLLFKFNVKLCQAALIFLFIVFICSYVQGNYFVKYLPVMDGRVIDWDLYARGGRFQSIILWIVVIAVVMLLVRVLSTKRMHTLIQTVSICMILLFSVTLVTLCMTNHGLENKTNLCVTTDYELTMSENQNFIILLLDALDGGAFSDMVIGNEEMESIFDDFTYYDNTMCAYPHTRYNVPFLLSGIWFENQMESDKYFDLILMDSPLFNELEQREYIINFYETDIKMTELRSMRLSNISQYTKKVSSYTDFARWQVLLVGMKYAPFDLKRFSFVDPNAFERLRIVEGESEALNNDNGKFYHMVNEQDIQYTANNQFKFIHLWGAHPPYEYDGDMNYLPDGVTFMQSVEACLTLSKSYLEKLKQSDVYDNSVIIIVADHGNSDFYEEDNMSQHPVLLIKGINERHSLQVDSRPISFENMYSAYIHLLDGVDGQTVFDDLPYAESRKFIYYDIKNDKHMVEYEQRGQVGDMSTMFPTGREFNAEESSQTE